jgi:molybdate transport system substrate-binding protein
MITHHTLVMLVVSMLVLSACGSKPESAQSSDGSDSGAVATSSTPQRDDSRELTVFAAASLRESLEELGAMYTERSDTKVTFNFGGSNELARQIVAGNGADIFLSAAENWMDTVERANRIVSGTRQDLLSNSLVVVGHSAAEYTVGDACALATLDFKTLALADPEAVPAGKYAKKWMEGVKCNGRSLWDAVQEKVSPSPDVRAALGLVMADPKFVGIVYRTDQLAHTEKTKVLFEVKDGPPIRYALAQVSEGPAADDAKSFIALLNGAEGRTVFEKHGFTVTTAVATAQ